MDPQELHVLYNNMMKLQLTLTNSMELLDQMMIQVEQVLPELPDLHRSESPMQANGSHGM